MVEISVWNGTERTPPRHAVWWTTGGGWGHSCPLLRICFLVLPWYWEGLTQLNHLQPLLSSLTSQELSTWEQSLSYCKRPKQSGYQCTLNCSVWRTGSPALSDRKYVHSFNHFLHSIKSLVIYWSPYTSYFYDFRGNYCAFYPCTLSGGLSF